MRQGCTFKVNKRYKLLFFSLLFLTLVVILAHGVPAESTAVFEISVSIIEDDALSPGGSFHVIAELRNRESEGRIDVIVTYDVLDSNDNVLISDSKTVAVETKSSFAEEFILPNSISEGTYYFRAVVNSLEGTKLSEASRSFNVFVVEEGEQRIIEYIMIIALVITMVGLLFEHKRVSKMKVSGKDLGKFFEKKE